MLNKQSLITKNELTDASYELAKRLSQHLKLVHFPKGKKLHLINKGEKLSYVVMDGVITISRINDGLMLAALGSPVIFGVGHFMQFKNIVIIETYTSCKVGVLTSDEFEELITKHDLWKLLSLHLISTINLLFSISTFISHPSAYEKIRTQLLLLNDEPDEIKNSFTVANYIRRKTLLSRSGIMRILSELRQGGYIEMENGFLMKINKLPIKY